MHYTEQIEQLKLRLQQPLPGTAAQDKMSSRVKVEGVSMKIPADAKESGVLALLFPVREELNLLLIRRTEDGRPHSGQIGFPGGRKEQQDNNDLQTTALRETFEEVGVASTDIEVLGALSSLYIPVSYSNVFPYVGYTPGRPDYTLSQDEVQYTLEVPVKELFNPAIKSVKKITPSAYPDISIEAPVYEWDAEHIIWGATAMMISELEEVMRKATKGML